MGKMKKVFRLFVTAQFIGLVCLMNQATPIWAKKDEGTTVGVVPQPEKWGQVSNGVQCRIIPNKRQVFADESLTFNVYLKNISNTPIFVPTLNTFLIKKHPQIKDFRHCPSFFIISNRRRDVKCLRII